MTSLLYAVMSITHVASLHCAERPTISPCTCEPHQGHTYVDVLCEKVDSFQTLSDALINKFDPNINISLAISYSQLEDLEMHSFRKMNLNIVKLRMQWNGLQTLPELTFRGLGNVMYLGIGNNELASVPKHILQHVPLIQTLDLSQCRIRSVLQGDFQSVDRINYLFLVSNNITRVERDTFPSSLLTLQLGRNQIENLNGSLVHLNTLKSLFIHDNYITNLDNELPESNSLKLIIAHNNRLERLPESMRFMDRLDKLQLHHNRLTSLNGTFSRAKNLDELFVYNNEIQYLDAYEFEACHKLTILDMSCNRIKSLNKSLLYLANLRTANFSFNEIEEFSMNEVRGLLYLYSLDLSNNRIGKLTGRQEKEEDQRSYLREFYLDQNLLKSLDGALMGLKSLHILGLSYNQIERISPEDFIGLDQLESLDLSHNQIVTLNEMQRTVLLSLNTLELAYNNLTRLDKDFHGLPELCSANLTNNQIAHISTDLVSKTRCMNHGVPGKLQLFLENNPIMCDPTLNDLCTLLPSQMARIRGRSACFRDQEVCTLLPMLFTQKDLPTDIPFKNKTDEKTELPILITSQEQPLIKPLIPPSPTTTTISESDSNHLGSVLKSEQTVIPTTTKTSIKFMVDKKRLSALTTIISTTPLPPLPSPLQSPKGSIISGENQPIVLDIENIPLNMDTVIFNADDNINSTGVNMRKDATGNVAEPGEAVTVSQTEYATVEYLPNHEDGLLPIGKSVGDHAGVDIQQQQEQENIELEDSKSNLVHDEYAAVVLASDMESVPHSLILAQKPPETP